MYQLISILLFAIACIFDIRAFGQGSQTEAPHFQSFQYDRNTGFDVVIGSENGRTYIVQASTNLINWEELGRITARGAAQPFNDPAVSHLKGRFYRLRVLPLIPTITSQPQSQTTVVGENVTFSVVASDTGPLNYQWLFFGTPIAGANRASLTITNLQVSHSGNYVAAVFNEAGTIYSRVVSLTVNVPTPVLPPSIRTQPLSQTVKEGDSVTFSVQATGSEPLSYEWRFNNTPIQGATLPSLTFSQANTNQAGSYVVVVSNTRGTVASTPAQLTVTPKVAPTDFAPTNIVQATMEFQITSSEGQTPGTGIYRLELFSTGTYRRVPIRGGILAAQGTYTYRKTGPNTGSITTVRAPNVINTIELLFSAAREGSYTNNISLPVSREFGTFTIQSLTSGALPPDPAELEP